MTNSILTAKLDNIIGGNYTRSSDYNDIHMILDEVEFLYSRGIFEEKGLGRLHDLCRNATSEN